jgi:hypothetical protein
VEFLRYLDGREKDLRERGEVERHNNLMDRLVRGAVVATGDYDVRKVFPDYFPLDTATNEVDYSRVEWDENIVFQPPSEDEMEMIQRMLKDDSVTVSGSSFAEPESEPDFMPVPPDGSPVIEQIETDREWV